MKIVLFYHSLISDWNHGNAHFLRGIVSSLIDQGNDVRVYEPVDAWSVQNLEAEYGVSQLSAYRDAYPDLSSVRYHLSTLDFDEVLEGADLVLVHEWNDHELVARIGSHRRTTGTYQLLFHDTHHRSVTDSQSMANYDLEGYDGVLAFGQVIRDLYLSRGWAKRAWTWHEAADTRIFKPLDSNEHDGDLVWIGNWGDDERTAELHEFLIEPVSSLGLRAKVYGVRYPKHALKALKNAGIEYGGWLPNYEAPKVFARYKVTVHVPRRPYVKALPGIPTIRVFEALACGIPLISGPWDDHEHLFTPGQDFLVAQNGEEMMGRLETVVADPGKAKEIADHGRQTVLKRHTCEHRVRELMEIYQELIQANAGESVPA